MSWFIPKAIGTMVAGGAIALLLSASAARGEDPEAAELRARLDQLTKQSEELQKLVKERQSAVGAGYPEAVTPKDVAKIVDDAMKEREAQTIAGKACDGAAGKDAWYQVGSDLGMTAAWNNGVWFSTKNKDFTFHVGGWLQQDFVWDGQSGAAQKDTTIGVLRDDAFARRAHVIFEGSAYDVVEWTCIYDFENNPDNSATQNLGTATSGNNPVTQFDDLWVGVKDIPILGRVRVGHVRDPIGLENYTSNRFFTFIENGTIQDAFLQPFQVGIWGFNNFCNNRVNLAWSFARPDAGNVDLNFGNSFAATGRIAALPVYYNDGRCLEHVAASYQYRTGTFDPAVNDNDFTLKVRPEIREGNILPFFLATPTFLADHAQLVNFENLSIWGPLWVQAEATACYISDATIPASATVPGKFIGDLHYWGGYISAGYFLTGESRGYDTQRFVLDRQKVNEPFFWVKGEDGKSHWGLGAWEICARASAVDLDATGARGGILRDYTVGLNWYLNPNLRWQFNYVVADRFVDGPKWSGVTQFVGSQVNINF